ncbi:MAG: hypothetical protein ACYTEP_00750 [Planctomycetota bacterium]
MPAPEGQDVEITMDMDRKLFGPITGGEKKQKVRGPVTEVSNAGK